MIFVTNRQIKGDVGSCKKVPEDVKLEMIAAYEKKIAETAAYMEAMQEEDEQEEDGILEIADLKVEKSVQQHQMKPPQLLPIRGSQIKKALLIFCSPKNLKKVSNWEKS